MRNKTVVPVDRVQKKKNVFFDILNPSTFSESRTFWKAVKSFFLDKRNYRNMSILVENKKNHR